MIHIDCLISFVFLLRDSYLVLSTSISKILYDDEDVEVLRLDRERWELVDNGLKAKVRKVTKSFILTRKTRFTSYKLIKSFARLQRSRSSKGFSPTGG